MTEVTVCTINQEQLFVSFSPFGRVYQAREISGLAERISYMSDNADPFDSQLLVELSRMRMPYGKYAGCPLVDLPEPYVVWFAQQGFPDGKLGEMLRIVYEIKLNGLEYLFDPLRE